MCKPCGCSGSPEETVTYECAKDKEKCPPKEVKKGEPVPECCGVPMTKKEA